MDSKIKVKTPKGMTHKLPFITEHKTLWMSLHVEPPDLCFMLSWYFSTRKKFVAPRKFATDVCVF